MLVRFYPGRQNGAVNTLFSETLSDKLHSYQINLRENIANSNMRIDGISVKDSSASVIPLKNSFYAGQAYLLVSRFSHLHCESCVTFSIKAMMQWAGVLGKDNILFLGSNSNNRVFNKEKQHYGIQNMNVYNIGVLSLPAEEMGFPYYFVLDSALRVTDVFVPDKAVPELTDKYLKMIGERYY
jgi:hypothetical protein